MSLNTLHIEAAKVTHDLSVDKPPHPNSRGCHQNAAIMGLNDLHTVDAIGLERESGAAVG